MESHDFFSEKLCPLIPLMEKLAQKNPYTKMLQKILSGYTMYGPWGGGL